MTSVNIALESEGFCLVPGIFNRDEVANLSHYIEAWLQENSEEDPHAIRRLLDRMPGIRKLLLTPSLKNLIRNNFGEDYFLTKAIYFNKPPGSNWFVPFHQDLTISVNSRVASEGFINWTFKDEICGVQPPVEVLQKTITARIHLDDATSENGALRVVPGSHKGGVILKGSEQWSLENTNVCEVDSGGVMFMKPLTLHASSRTTNGMPRRVIHLEFCNRELPRQMDWLERTAL